MSTIKSIAIRAKSRDPMQVIDQASISVAMGISGDFRGSQKNRQVTILSESAWRSTCDSIGADLPWTTRRANILVDGVEFSESDIGTRIQIGDCELEISEETDPCALMDSQHQGLKAALMPDWRGGVCCNVIKAGNIKVGDSLTFA
ncbi:MAG: MOSC domain-containing protein YiiM [Planctomycetota bacterium]|jgi:MOSC domain-containing protein YiiM